MKRIALGVATGLALALAPIGLAQASGTSGSQVSINQYADFDEFGTNLDVGLQVSCTGDTGVVNVSVDQAYPETPDPLGAHGTGVMDVVCDGKTHNVGVTIVGVIYDAGKATAKATLTAPSGTVTTTRQIVIRVV